MLKPTYPREAERHKGGQGLGVPQRPPPICCGCTSWVSGSTSSGVRLPTYGSGQLRRRLRMRALMIEADWEPRGSYSPEEGDEERRLARNGNQVWRHPRFRVVELPQPTPGPDEVLIRVKACGICGSDVHMYERDDEGYMVYPGMMSTPVVTGHEFSGIVEDVGKDVVDLHPGDPVCSEEIAWCGECYACRAGLFIYCERLGELGFTFNGAHAEYVVTKAKYCWPIGE